MKSEDLLHTCSDCGKSFNSIQSLKHHSYRHITNRPHKCPLCTKSYGRSAHLKRHINISHGKLLTNFDNGNSILDGSDSQENNCHSPVKDIATTASMQYSDVRDDEWQHSPTRGSSSSTPYSHHSASKLYNCKYCEKSFMLAAHLKEHIDTHPNSRPFECLSCDKSFMSASALHKHKKRHPELQNKTFASNKQTTFSSHKAYANKRLVDTEHTYINTSAPSSSALLNQTVPPLTNMYECPHCANYYSRSKYLEKHLLTHHPHTLTQTLPVNHNKNFDCQFCGQCFSQCKLFEEHLLKFHQNNSSSGGDGGGLFKCEHCEKSYKSRPSMLKHAKNHFISKTRLCVECNRSFTDYLKFLRHKSSHLRHTLHQCQHCHKNYSKKIYLQKHLLTHAQNVSTNDEGGEERTRRFGDELNENPASNCTDSKSFACNICGQTFGMCELLDQHFKLRHSKDRSINNKFECEYCQKTYSKKKYLEKHRLSHLKNAGADAFSLLCNKRRSTLSSSTKKKKKKSSEVVVDDEAGKDGDRDVVSEVDDEREMEEEGRCEEEVEGAIVGWSAYDANEDMCDFGAYYGGIAFIPD